MTRSRRLHVENLERRELLAGNVAISVTGGSVTVTADDADNRFSIYQQANGRFNVVGFDGETFTGPTTNLLIRNLTVNLGGGRDHLGIGKQSVVSLPGSPAQILGVTTVNGGTGGKLIVVLVNGREVGGQVMPALAINVDTSPTTAAERAANLRDDDVLVAYSSAAVITARTGGGKDALGYFQVEALQLTGDTRAATTTGSNTDGDVVQLDSVVALNAVLSTGGGANLVQGSHNLIGNLTLTTGNGADDIQLHHSVIATSFTLNTNGGADTVDLHDIQVGITPTTPDLFPQYGIDVSRAPFDLSRLIRSLPTLPGFLIISTGDGNDVVEATGLVSTLSISISLDGGDDQLFATDIEAFYSLFNGGLGTDGKLLSGIEGFSWAFLFEEELLAPPPPNVS